MSFNSSSSGVLTIDTPYAGYNSTVAATPATGSNPVTASANNTSAPASVNNSANGSTPVAGSTPVTSSSPANATVNNTSTPANGSTPVTNPQSAPSFVEVLRNAEKDYLSAKNTLDLFRETLTKAQSDFIVAQEATYKALQAYTNAKENYLITAYNQSQRQIAMLQLAQSPLPTPPVVERRDDNVSV